MTLPTFQIPMQEIEDLLKEKRERDAGRVLDIQADEPIPDGYKQCGKCKLVLTLESFDRKKTGKHGRDSHCKLCRKAYNAARKGGTPRGHWRGVRMVHDKPRVQDTLDRLSAAEGLPALVLSKFRSVYAARQFDDSGPPHPLVRIVVRGHESVAVLFDGEVYE